MCQRDRPSWRSGKHPSLTGRQPAFFDHQQLCWIRLFFTQPGSDVSSCNRSIHPTTRHQSVKSPFALVSIIIGTSKVQAFSSDLYVSGIYKDIKSQNIKASPSSLVRNYRSAFRDSQTIFVSCHTLCKQMPQPSGTTNSIRVICRSVFRSGGEHLDRRHLR